MAANLPEMSPRAKAKVNSLSVDVKKREEVKRSLYWFGMLPLSGEFMVPMYPLSSTGGDGKQRVPMKFTAKSFWAIEGRGWAGKAVLSEGALSPTESFHEDGLRSFRTLQSVSLGGVCFTAYSDTVMIDDGQVTKTPYPGMIAPLTDKQVDAILKASQTVVIQRGKLTNLSQGDHGPVDPNDPNTRPLVPEVEAEPGDRPMAEFVYLIKLDADYKKFRQDEASKWCPMNMGEFLDAPPQMLAKFVETVPA